MFQAPSSEGGLFSLNSTEMSSIMDWKRSSWSNHTDDTYQHTWKNDCNHILVQFNWNDIHIFRLQRYHWMTLLVSKLKMSYSDMSHYGFETKNITLWMVSLKTLLQLHPWKFDTQRKIDCNNLLEPCGKMLWHRWDTPRPLDSHLNIITFRKLSFV